MKHFERYEFECPCCEREEMDGDFLSLLDEIRDCAGVPFVVNSGWRCAKHNDDVGGVVDSAHVWGVAADIRAATPRERYAIVSAALEIGIRRIGIGSDFVHLDVDEDLPQRVIWTYQ